MYCKKCGASLRSDDVFCRGCGAQFGKRLTGRQKKFLGFLINAALAVVFAIVLFARISETRNTLSAITCRLVRQSLQENAELMKTLGVDSVENCCLEKAEGNSAVTKVGAVETGRYVGTVHVKFKRRNGKDSGSDSSLNVIYKVIVTSDDKQVSVESQMSEEDQGKLVEFLLLGNTSSDDGAGGDDDSMEEDEVENEDGADSSNESIQVHNANVSELEDAQDEATSPITGAEIIAENASKPHGYSSAQRANLIERLQGRMLTFENGRVYEVHKRRGCVSVVIMFNVPNTEAFYKGALTVHAVVTDPTAMKIAEQFDNELEIKSLTGKLVCDDSGTHSFELINAKIVPKGEPSRMLKFDPATVTGDDIVRENSKKHFLDAQRENLQENLSGKVLTFRNGSVMTVRNRSNCVEVIIFFYDPNDKSTFPVPFTVTAYVTDPVGMKKAEDLDEEAEILSLTGKVIPKTPLALFFEVTDAKIVASGESPDDSDKVQNATSNNPVGVRRTDEKLAEYEAILREAMPVAMTMQGVPKDQIESAAAQEIEKELRKFRESSDEDKEKALKGARESMPKIRALKKGGPEAEAIKKEAADSAESAALAKRGRNLFVAIVAANVEREAAGSDSVWPKNRMTKSSNAKDISGRLFASATDYFNVLLDQKNPYVEGVDEKVVISPETKKASWHVAQGVTDDLDDCVPVLVSANVDQHSLVTKAGHYDASRLTGNLRFSGSYAVVILKGGSARIIKAKEPSLANVYGRSGFTLPQGFGYLEPEGSAQDCVDNSDAVEPPTPPAKAKRGAFDGNTKAVTGLVHRWSFNGSLMEAGGVMAKSVGNVTTDGRRYSTHGGGNGASFMDLGGFGNLTQSTPVTLEMWVTRHACSAWAGGRTLSIGTIPTNGNFLQMVDDHVDIVVNNKVYVLNIGSSPNDREYYIALIFDECQGGWVARGLKIDVETCSVVRQSQVTITAGDPILAFAPGKLLLAKALTTLGQDGDGRIDFNEFRIWNRALDPLELRSNAKAGPDAILSSGKQEETAACFCSQCGTKVVKDARFCGKCGSKISCGASERATKPRSYYRLTIKKSFTDHVQMSEFSLYDANGRRVNSNLMAADVSDGVDGMPENSFVEMGNYKHGEYFGTHELAANLFDGKVSTKCCWLNVNADGREPSWRVLVVRLPDGTRAESYSFTAANNYLPERNPSAWTMESSANGADWEVVDVRNVNQQDTPSRAHVEFNRMRIR